MQNNDQHIDKAFNQKLANFEVNPPVEVWNRISDSIDQRRKRRLGFWMIGLSSAASLLLAFTMGWYFANHAIEKETLFSQNRKATVQPENNLAIASPDDPKNNVQSNKLQTTRYTQQLVKITNKKGSVVGISEKGLMKSNDDDKLMAFLSPLQTFPISNTGFNAVLMEMKNTDKKRLSATDFAIIESNLLALNSSDENQNEKEKGKWAVGLQGSPVYNFDQPSIGKTYAQNSDYALAQNNVATTYTANVSGGLMVEYATGNRLTVQTGVNYAGLSQNGGEIGISFDARNWVTDSGEMIYETSDLNSKGGIGSANTTNQVVLNTEVGLANITMKQGATLASSKNMNSIVPDVNQNYKYQQQARYVEVPMILRYNLIDKRVGMHLLGGINTNFLVGNMVQLVNENEVIASGKIEGMRSLSFSSSLGLGLNYELTSRFNLSVEPTLKVQLNSLNANNNFDSRPYTFGVFSGVAYRF